MSNELEVKIHSQIEKWGKENLGIKKKKNIAKYCFKWLEFKRTPEYVAQISSTGHLGVKMQAYWCLEKY